LEIHSCIKKNYFLFVVIVWMKPIFVQAKLPDFFLFATSHDSSSGDVIMEIQFCPVLVLFCFVEVKDTLSMSQFMCSVILLFAV
jgi:hypothetical protein